MSIIKNQFKVKNGENFDVLYSETSADVVKYSDTTVAGVLDKLGTTYVEKVAGKDLSTNDFTAAYKQTIDDLSTTYVEKVSGKDLSTNDFSNSYKQAIDDLGTTYVKQVSGKDLSTNDFTNAYKTALDDLDSTYAKKSDIADVFHYKGTVANFSSIPSDTAVGDVWNIAADGGTDENGIAIMAGDNVAKTATGFDVLAGTVDLSGYVQKDGNKVLSTNDFTDADKNKLDSLGNGTAIYIGTTQPTDANTIWFDTTGY